MVFQYISCNLKNFTPVSWWWLNTGSHQKVPCHTEMFMFYYLLTVRGHTKVHTNLYDWLHSFQQIMLQCRLQLMPWATGWLLRRCLSTRCKEVRRANEQQELVKPLWQLEVWPSGIWWAPFHGLWFPPRSLWKVTLAWWAHRSLWGSSILQTTGRCAINPRWPSF